MPSHLLAKITSALLCQGKIISHFSVIVFLAFIGLLIGRILDIEIAIIFVFFAIASLYQMYAQFRVSFDVDLFKLLAEFDDIEKGLEELDASLQLLALKKNKENRSLEERAKGSKKWLKHQLCSFLFQFLLLVLLILKIL